MPRINRYSDHAPIRATWVTNETHFEFVSTVITGADHYGETYALDSDGNCILFVPYKGRLEISLCESNTKP